MLHGDAWPLTSLTPAPEMLRVAGTSPLRDPECREQVGLMLEWTAGRRTRYRDEA